MQYNIIGDIHGRNVWKQLVREDEINIFVGDYLDPYPQEDITDEAAWENFREILHYRNQHPDTIILLWGNHDLHYIFPKERYSRYCRRNGEKMQGLYHKGLLRNLQLSYTIGDHTLVTHAGVTKEWWNMVCRLLHRALPATPAFVGKLLNTVGAKSVVSALCWTRVSWILALALPRIPSLPTIFMAIVPLHHLSGYARRHWLRTISSRAHTTGRLSGTHR